MIRVCLLFLSGLALWAAIPCAAAGVTPSFPNLVLDKASFEVLSSAWRSHQGPLYEAVRRLVVEPADRALADRRAVAHPVAALTGPNGRAAMDEAGLVLLLCEAAVLTDNSSYLGPVAEMLTSWAQVNQARTRNSVYEGSLSSLVEGYSLVREQLEPRVQTVVNRWLRQRGEVLTRDEPRPDNWGTCLLEIVQAYGLVTGDAGLLSWAESRLPRHLAANLEPDGRTRDLIDRDAFAYHAYDLLFWAQIAVHGAYYGVPNSGEALYRQKTAQGASIQGAVEYWKPFLIDPAGHPHNEFVGTGWKPDQKKPSFGKPYRPQGTLYVVDQLAFLDASLQGVQDQYRAQNPYATWSGLLSRLHWSSLAGAQVVVPQGGN